jgi:hypothetical protein
LPRDLPTRRGDVVVVHEDGEIERAAVSRVWSTLDNWKQLLKRKQPVKLIGPFPALLA